MNKKRFMAMVMAAVCVCLLALPVCAADTRASDQIKLYTIDVTAVTDALRVDFSVTGSGAMDKLGCESIDVYRRSGTRWIPWESLDEFDDGMSKDGGMSYKNAVYCDGQAGVSYKVEVTVFAENSAGRDTRSKTVYVTGK